MRTRPLMLLSTLLSSAALIIAYISQHQWGMQPCPWCVLQRLIFMVIAAWGLLGLMLHRAAATTALSALWSTGQIGLSLAGMAAAFYQHFYASQSRSCALTLADKIVSGLTLDQRWPDFFEVRASCADAATTLWGLSYDFWSLGLFALLCTMALTALLTILRRRTPPYR